MSTAFVLGLDHAALALGVSREILLSRIESDQVPEALQTKSGWMVPTEALAAVADREGWPLSHSRSVEPALIEIPDTTLFESRTEPSPSTFELATMAAPASPVDPRSQPQDQDQCVQATPPKALTLGIPNTMVDVSYNIDSTEGEIARLTSEVNSAEHQLALAERAQAIAEARVEELRRQIEQERSERSALISRVRALETDREHAMKSMSRRSRRRYLKIRRKVRAAPNTPPAPPIQFSTKGNAEADTTGSNPKVRSGHSIPNLAAS